MQPTKSQKFRKKYPNYDREWYAKNREKCLKSGRKSYLKNLEKQRLRSRIKNRKSRIENPEKWKEYGKKNQYSPSRRYNNYRQNAKQKGVDFLITRDQFMEFWGKPCSYCGETINHVGIDRVNNSLGYIEGNLRSCCQWCNRMKMDHTEKDFLDKCRKISAMNP